MPYEIPNSGVDKSGGHCNAQAERYSCSRKERKRKEVLSLRQRPYHAESTGSCPITEVRHHWALSVLVRVTT
ncbi:hypothetical protein NPIL_576921 [Nephila pilipes]|uniref:Uncharacterized protein n=1 Tax=Nephila pilipes TaxID=299642 RepID=A0A8X6NBK5_NEPPI|nr:hypothetical protein NPIL_576921 [Nephila pilipes]